MQELNRCLPCQMSRHLLTSVIPKAITIDDAADAFLLHQGTGRRVEFQKVVRIAQWMMIAGKNSSSLSRLAINEDVSQAPTFQQSAPIKGAAGDNLHPISRKYRLNTHVNFYKFMR